MVRPSRPGNGFPSTALVSACGRSLLAGVVLLCAGCGSSDGPISSDAPQAPPPATSEPGATNASIRSAFNALRASCGGTTLGQLGGNDVLVTAATRHAGWQMLDNVSQGTVGLNHYEPRNNALYTAYDLGDRVDTANGGASLIASGYYYEIIASTFGTNSVGQLWNTVYHRLPMARHQSTAVGYGDIALGRIAYPSASLPQSDLWGNGANNGYATMDMIAPSGAAITASWWPVSGATQVARSFANSTESPRPIASVDLTGGPFHAIFPTTAGFTALSVTVTTGGTHAPCFVLVGGGTTPTAGGDVSSADLLRDPAGDLDAGEVFILTKTPMTANTAYTWSLSATAGGVTYAVPSQTFTTGP